MRRRKKWFSHAGALLEGALGSVDQANLANLAKVTAAWPRIVGEQMAVVSLPAQLKYRKLTIHVTEPVWVDSLLFLKSAIITKTNRLTGAELIDSIQVIRKQFPTQPVVAAEPERKETPLPDEVVRRIEEVVASIEDLELRSTFKRVMLKSEQTSRKGETPSDSSGERDDKSSKKTES